MEDNGWIVLLGVSRLYCYGFAGPNPLFGGLKSTKSMFGKSSHVWIEGEGMLHALYFVKDRHTGTWNISYKNKHVQTDTFKLETVRKKPGFLPAIEGDSLAIVLAYLLNMVRFLQMEHSNTYCFFFMNLTQLQLLPLIKIHGI